MLQQVLQRTLGAEQTLLVYKCSVRCPTELNGFYFFEKKQNGGGAPRWTSNVLGVRPNTR